MGRKRGGLAGIWDRNKQIIKPVVSGIAGLVGTPALGAAVGAAMGGLDREGKSGIGFDAGQGLKGAVSGYGAGSLGSMAGGLATKAGMNVGQGALSKLNTGGSKLGNMFLGKAPVPAVSPTIGGVSGPTAPSPMGIGNGMPTDGMPVDLGAYGDAVSPNGLGLAPSLPSGGAIPLQSGVNGQVASGAARASAGRTIAGAGQGAASSPNLLSRLGSSIEANPNAWAMGANAASNALTSGSENRQNDANAELTAAQAAKLQYETDVEKRKEESLQRLREMLSQSMPNSLNSVPSWTR